MDTTIKSWHHFGCTCDSCMSAKELDYAEAFQKYEEQGKLSVRFVDWDNGEDYGTTLYINGHDCGEVMHHPEEAAMRVLEFLNISAEIEYAPAIDDLYQIP